MSLLDVGYDDDRRPIGRAFAVLASAGLGLFVVPELVEGRAQAWGAAVALGAAAVWIVAVMLPSRADRAERRNETDHLRRGRDERAGGDHAEQQRHPHAVGA
ncbi:hypothetical protein, partial [Mesorhizobium japonicum]|uniref:hypothetical protein n=1 Tax=Mesorhizobium japonicum TaxID=2066070 RepID=UPI003B5B0226